MREDETAASGEDRLIARYFKPLARDPGAFGLDDDAAALTPPAGCDLVLTADAIVAGIHFFPEDPPDTVARKALRVNLSDLAAKGARPLGFLLTLALPGQVADTWLAGFASGLGADAELFGCPLLGGDTVRTPGPVAISVTAVGAVPHGGMLRRAGARPGDRILVTGTIGDAALGLLLRRDRAMAERCGLSPDQRDRLAERYLLPEPRNALAQLLGANASAAIDVSDGLAGDLAKLCRTSGVAAEVEIARVPLSEGARAILAREPALVETILTGGDDYEVLATMSGGTIDAFRGQASALGIAVTEIGKIIVGKGEARFLDAGGRPLLLAHPSFSHF
jgi:thiamine-monophosphate kinase